ncbi:Crp/Fnr family transcriptional regulator [Chondrinema litorale]|uniref:Crp/Fnr family transcriptional regulator n=1 Tax=Chondrinema litorale TaxID=2994555 RepID=UPI002543F160|nr:Crp/Fnr family transcriptional regulator [Chondrinema litorale]UZR96152.1 Crp/Fnr family transcriptional regulator [Chondrinema litorale]
MSDTSENNLDVWKQFSHLFTRKTVAPKAVLLNEGEVSKNAYFLEKGCLRLWFNHDGKDITFQFFFEGEGVSSIESFKTGEPSLFTIETIEACELIVIRKNDFQTIMDSSPAIKKEIEHHIFKRLMYYQKLFLGRIRDNPEKRYHELLENYPHILQRVPQHYIASYLGITPVSLSRIRNRR